MLGLGNAVMCGSRASVATGTVKALYHFENNLSDSSGFSNTLTQLSGNVNQYVTGGSQLVGTYSWGFNGHQSYVGTYGSNAIINDGKKFTIDLVLKFLNGGRLRIPIESSQIAMIDMGVYSGTGFSVSVTDSLSNQTGANLSSITPGTQAFIRITYDLTTVSVYVNGSLAVSAPMLGLTPDNQTLYFILNAASTSPYTVLIDELRVVKDATLDGTVVPSLPLTTTP